MPDELARRLEVAWEKVLQQAAGDPQWLSDLSVPLIISARATPELARLFPFRSLNGLCFSRCSDYPFTLDCPCVGVLRSGYVVQGTWAVSDEPQLPLLGVTLDLEHVLRVLLEHLPSDHSTWVGTRDDAI